MATQVLPSQDPFVPRGSPFGIGMYPGFEGFEGVNQPTFQGFQPEPHTQNPYMMASAIRTSEDSFRRAPSLSPNQMRIPVRRDRTPIQHSRRSVPRERARSHSRTEMLLSYASEQMQTQQPQVASQASVTVVPSQSAPTTPQIFPMPASYSAPAPPIAAAPYDTSGGYFPTLIGQPNADEMPELDFRSGPHFQEYYSISRSASGSVGMPGMNPQNVYLNREEQPNPSTLLPSIPTTIASFPPVQNALESSTDEVEIMSPRPKPQCWDHGCNGRQFSTFSNLLRHQREKSGSAMKAMCPYCGIEFTRTTARNGHMYGGKCKGRSDRASSEPSRSDGEQEA
ncbi:uncharacterized protein HMPREF1541_05909 [Cyphellophora europaea CBS 101466]|uniref:C2H2-type domain-containing protein n=1 Tax=Cyphellophora europaea (strain CBS 101466) TaxID=1220924 RepID=W2RV78_CYPE1|nr:uncharacterized protein HMPREF1541_05909 [Cyphellophora europaea CBS 101466]ETN39683.1 hypothetical protein HMPREF1541_05909 [Cyphellophora europaea CBS 101466]